MLRVLDQWEELKTHFGIARATQKCLTADLLYGMYSDVKNKIYLVFLKPVLAEVQKVNKVFQDNDVDVTKLLQDLTLLITGLAKMVRGFISCIHVRL